MRERLALPPVRQGQAHPMKCPAVVLRLESDTPWHALAGDEVLQRFETKETGLSKSEAGVRLAAFGRNIVPKEKRRGIAVRIAGQFANPLVHFLLVAAAASALLSDFLDSIVIVLVVLINALVGFLQEGRAERSVSAIHDLIAQRAVVLRDNHRHTVDAAELVPGDVVLLQPGWTVPADLRLLGSQALTIDEARLTGESLPADKEEAPVEAGAPLGDRRSMAFSSTLVVHGNGRGVVTATGGHSRIGRIAGLLRETAPLTTPLLRQVGRFTRRLAIFAVAATLLLFGFSVLVRGFSWSDALIAAVALAVGAIPEGVPAVITITLAIGVQRMADRKAAIRSLPAVETLGAVSVICTDKTGTLTRNEMMARHVLVEEHQLEITGSGLRPEGDIIATGHDDDSSALAAASAIIQAGLLCNDARLQCVDGVWTAEGDPMEAALETLARKAGLNPAHVRSEWQRLDEVPFDRERRLMATLHRSPQGEIVAFVKGAPERLLAMSNVDRAIWEDRLAKAAAQGERMLGFGLKRFSEGLDKLTPSDLDGAVEFLGLIGFVDPPRPEARDAIAECRAAGIKVKMVTGDHVETALAIARQLGLAEEPTALTGSQIDSLSDTDLGEAVLRCSVFARTSPEHKLRLVRALQAQGAIVAMTGDGVNDAPPLKQADVGIAMGIKGTDAAREASAIVLLDDNFASIIAAVREGRTVYDNIRKVIALTLPTDGGEILVVVLAILFGFTLPITPTQILWVNLITAVTLGIVLAFEPAEPGIMRRPPRRADAPLLSAFLLWRVVFMSLVFTGLSLGVFFVMVETGRDLASARTMVVNTLVVAEVAYLFNVRYLHVRSLSFQGVVGTPHVWAALAGLAIAQLLFTFLPGMHRWFGTASLGVADGLAILALGAALLLLLELEKGAMRATGLFDELR